MQRTGIMLVVSGVLVIAGLGLMVLGSQVILEGVIQGGGMVGTAGPLVVEAEFDSDEADAGVSAVQIPGFAEGTFSASIRDPSGTELVFRAIDSETVEDEFDVVQSGVYTLTVSGDGDGTQAFGAIGPLPDPGKKSLGFISSYLLIVGLGGLAVTAYAEVRNRRRRAR